MTIPRSDSTLSVTESIKSGVKVVIDSISVAFGNGTVIDSLSFAVNPGEKIILSGPSGSGKSSVLGCILGFIQPAHGQIMINDTPVTAENIWKKRKSIGYVPQEPSLGEGIVREWVEEQYDLTANKNKKHALYRLPEILKSLNLTEEILGQNAAELSGGEKQRVALAAVMPLERPLLLLDEPTSALDSESRKSTYVCLSNLKNTTVIMVSHDHTEAVSFTDKVVKIGSKK